MTLGSVNKLTLAQVYSDVAGGVGRLEEDEIAGPHVLKYFNTSMPAAQSITHGPSAGGHTYVEQSIAPIDTLIA